MSELLAQPAGFIKYLSHEIENKVICTLGQEDYDNIICELRNASFYSIILDITQDASKIGQLSQVFRCVKIIHNGKENSVNLQIAVVFYFCVD